MYRLSQADRSRPVGSNPAAAHPPSEWPTIHPEVGLHSTDGPGENLCWWAASGAFRCGADLARTDPCSCGPQGWHRCSLAERLSVTEIRYTDSVLCLATGPSC